MYWKRMLSFVVLTLFIVTTPVLAQANKTDEVELTIIELVLRERKEPIEVYAIPPEDDSMTNENYKPLGYHWDISAHYWVNTKNKYGLVASTVEEAIKSSAQAWDIKTSAQVFEYKGQTSRTAGRYDGYNVVAWGSYQKGVIAVAFIWHMGSKIVETDTRMNTYYKWSLTGEAGKMDVQNIMTHEFGHWCGLADLYYDADYWLSMYGYSEYGETYKRTLGKGDILGLQAFYGPSSPST